ncbi:MAG: tryptophan synthase subunit alpha [Aigarchaeota archaeon]|nr:tryptophan synthase subunit alpha [Aigarchaeota archaeon]MDW8092520.1 tryptophan synthase subunit alpha [Nitrososphaerota archaeon]
MRLREFMSSGRRLIVYVTLGDDLVKPQLIQRFMHSGCDVLELGLPTPLAKYDGPTIRRSIARALRTCDGRVRELLDMVRQFDAEQKVLFTYFEFAANMGLREVYSRAAEHVESVLFPDLLIDYPERVDEYVAMSREYGLELTFFVPTTVPHRLVTRIASLDPAFVYLGLMISTGVHLPVTAERNIGVIKRLLGQVPLVVGFAVRTPEQVRRYVAAGADGVVVGSAILKMLEEGEAERSVELVRSLKEAMES